MIPRLKGLANLKCARFASSLRNKTVCVTMLQSPLCISLGISPEASLCGVVDVPMAVYVLDQYRGVCARICPPGNSGGIYIVSLNLSLWLLAENPSRPRTLSKPQDSDGALPILTDQPPLITTDETLAEEGIPHFVSKLDFLVVVIAVAL